MYRVELSRQAQRYVQQLPPSVQARIIGITRSLALDPQPRGHKKLVGTRYLRIRAGDWRVVYGVLDREHVVVVVKIVRRSESTYKDL